MTFLEAIGFTRADRDEPGGSVGSAQCYCVVDSDEEVDAVHEKALAAGATSIRPPVDQGYGGRGCTIRDAECNKWSFGSYRGE